MGLQYADGINRVGGVNWMIALCLLGVFIIVYFAMWKGIKSSGKVTTHVLKIETKSLKTLAKIRKHNMEINRFAVSLQILNLLNSVQMLLTYDSLYG